jgi:8-oxo-dGTP diphosphatase
MSGKGKRGQDAANSIDVVLCTPHGRHLAVLLVRDDGKKARERWCLPWDGIDEADELDKTAARIPQKIAGAKPTWLVQAGAFGDGRRHPGKVALSVAYVGVTPHRSAAKGAQWFPVSDLPPVPPRHRAMIEACVAQLRERMHRSPIAFRLLPAEFTLAELQGVYELLLGRRIHKASFRRSLAAASLVAATDEWRSEGRGRPAQLFRYAPKKRRGARGAVRFDAISD